jgi:hypothetical protein
MAVSLAEPLATCPIMGITNSRGRSLNPILGAVPDKAKAGWSNEVLSAGSPCVIGFPFASVRTVGVLVSAVSVSVAAAGSETGAVGVGDISGENELEEIQSPIGYRFLCLQLTARPMKAGKMPRIDPRPWTTEWSEAGSGSRHEKTIASLVCLGSANRSTKMAEPQEPHARRPVLRSHWPCVCPSSERWL